MTEQNPRAAAAVDPTRWGHGNALDGYTARSPRFGGAIDARGE